MDTGTELEMIFFALDEDSQSFLLETGRALVKRTEMRTEPPPRPKLTLVPPRLLKPVKNRVNRAVKLITPTLISKPKCG